MPLSCLEEPHYRGRERCRDSGILAISLKIMNCSLEVFCIVGRQFALHLWKADKFSEDQSKWGWLSVACTIASVKRVFRNYTSGDVGQGVQAWLSLCLTTAHAPIRSVGEVERTAHPQLSGRDSITGQLAVSHPLNDSFGIPYSDSHSGPHMLSETLTWNSECWR